MKTMCKTKLYLLLFLLCITLVGCGVPGMPPMSSIPPDTHPVVRKLIKRMYLDAQYRGAACDDLGTIASGHAPKSSGLTDRHADPAIPFLVACLRDDSYVWSPSIWVKYVGTPVGDEAKTALVCIGEPAVPALREALNNKNQKIRARAASALAIIESSHVKAQDE